MIVILSVRSPSGPVVSQFGSQSIGCHQCGSESHVCQMLGTCPDMTLAVERGVKQQLSLLTLLAHVLVTLEHFSCIILSLITSHCIKLHVNTHANAPRYLVGGCTGHGKILVQFVLRHRSNLAN